MKIVIVGATGTIGKAVVNEMKDSHTVISVARRNGDYQVDITDQQSINAM